MEKIHVLNSAAKAATPDLVLALAAEAEPKQIVCIFIDGEGRQQTLSSNMPIQDLSFLYTSFSQQVLDFMKEVSRG